MIDFNIY